jgi:hypothetical protein
VHHRCSETQEIKIKNKIFGVLSSNPSSTKKKWDFSYLLISLCVIYAMPHTVVALYQGRHKHESCSWKGYIYIYKVYNLHNQLSFVTETQKPRVINFDF